MFFQIEEAPWTPLRMNPKSSTLAHAAVPLWIQRPGQNLKSGGRKAIYHTQRRLHEIICRLLSRNSAGQKEWDDAFKVLKEEEKIIKLSTKNPVFGKAVLQKLGLYLNSRIHKKRKQVGAGRPGSGVLGRELLIGDDVQTCKMQKSQRSVSQQCKHT